MGARFNYNLFTLLNYNRPQIYPQKIYCPSEDFVRLRPHSNLPLLLDTFTQLNRKDFQPAENLCLKTIYKHIEAQLLKKESWRLNRVPEIFPFGGNGSDYLWLPN